MLALALGLLSSLGIGVGDFLASQAGRRTRAVPLVTLAAVAGTLTALTLTQIVASRVLMADVALGALTGVLIAAALTLLYTGMTASSVGIVSPSLSVVTAAIPIVVAATRGEPPSRLTSFGVVLALAAIVPMTISPHLGHRALVGLAYGIGGGVCFGSAYSVLTATSVESGMWPVVSQRTVIVAALALVSTARGVDVLPRLQARTLSFVSGLLGTAGIAAFTAGVQRGSVALVVVAGSLYPAVTTGLAVAFSSERMRWWQVLGVTLGLTGVALAAFGSVGD